MGPDGKPSKWALRCSIRIKEVMGHGGYVDTEQIIHLLVDDVELPSKNAHSGVLDANETWDTDALFIIPANVNRVGLIVGRSKDAPSFLERLLASFSRQRTGTAKIGCGSRSASPSTNTPTCGRREFSLAFRVPCEESPRRISIG